MMLQAGNVRYAVRPKKMRNKWHHSRHPAFTEPIGIMLLLHEVTHILR